METVATLIGLVAAAIYSWHRSRIERIGLPEEANWYPDAHTRRVGDVVVSQWMQVLDLPGRPRVALLEAPCAQPGMKLVITRGWNERPLPRRRPAGTDAIGRAAAPSVERLLAALPPRTAVAVMVDGEQVAVLIDQFLTRPVLDQLVALAARLATWDVAFTRVLLDLPDGEPADDPELAPAVALRPDGLLVGLRGDQAVARLDGAEEPTGRDPGSIHAAIGALRARAVARGVYR